MRRLLQEAALDLFRERGYDATTTADIAARAGVTERTYFRHFPDKREVLFEPEAEAELLAVLVRGVRAAPAGAPPMRALLAAFPAAATLVDANRWFTLPRRDLILRTPALAERAAAKEVRLVVALARELCDRGTPERQAGLAAAVGMAGYARITADWFDDPSRDLIARLADISVDLQELTGQL